jgi:hypothetical protein
VESITCPVIVIHGRSDIIVDAIHAQHTAAIVPSAELRILDELGPFSIETEVLPRSSTCSDADISTFLVGAAR